MDEENAVELLQRYRRDRRILLDFILSGSLIKKVVMPPGAVTLDDVDLDQVSVDHVLNCAKKGGMLDLSESIRDYHDHTGLPQISNTGSAGDFYLVTSPESSGSPPKRAPPPDPAFTPPPVYTPSPVSTPASVSALAPTFAPSSNVSNVSRSESFNSTQVQELTVDDIEDFEDDDDAEEVDSLRVSRRNTNDASDLALKLPSFATGITDDDLRETAYEVLLACAGATGGLIVPSKEKKKDKRSKLMRKLGRSRSENVVMQSQHAPGLVGLLETMRVQMEISEAMDIRTRQGLLNALVGKVGKRMDTLLIPLELLCCISRTEFSDKKAFIRWQKRQLNILEEGLINQPVVGFGESGRKASELRILLAKIEESESLPPSTGELQRTEALRSLREIAILLAERPARGDLTGEVCHWIDGYPLNVRLYEKLLLSVFDMLDEGKLTEEVEEILELLKSTWRVLGITETIHYTCYAWVLFRQYVITSDQGILRHAMEQLKKIPLKEQRGPQERLHLNGLHSKVEQGGFRESSFLQSFLSPIQKWADKQLGDYHLHFAERSAMMEHIVAVAMVTRRLLLEEPEALQSISITDRDQIESYISSSIKNAFSRIESISGTLVMRWVNSQLGRILGWVERAIQQERWEPISPQQRHGSSIVEVYRIVEETVDQFFTLKVPMRSTELNSVFRGIDNAFQVYANHVIDKLASKEDLIPPAPILTRYKKEAGIKAFVKKELFDHRLTDEKRSTDINVLTTPTLCVQLNTLHYAISQLNKLEDSIWERWTKKMPREKLKKKSIDEKSKSFIQKDAFDGSRKDINAAIDRICEFTGTKIIFWDLRDQFIDNLYKPRVGLSRLEALIEPLDAELSRLCNIIVEPLRDRIVTSLLQASLEGLLRVLLDGGPSRLFSLADGKLLEEDLEVLKEFFISGGDGLPRGVVENHLAPVRHVIQLHGYGTQELIDDLRSMSGSDMQDSRSKLGAEPKTLLRILAHRADSEASQFLKKQYKIPKSSA
ncbi:hypothetical protein I3843_13G013900 [Carya illinoinensis]|nr:hypothetical protein I3843_13G013900 [Carya illinoinensis]